MMNRTLLAAVFLALGCAHSKRSSSALKCSVDAQVGLLQAVAEAEPDRRTAMIQELIAECPSETSLLQAMLNTTVLTPIEVQLPQIVEPLAPQLVEVVAHLSVSALTIGEDTAPLDASTWDTHLRALSAQAIEAGQSPVLVIRAQPDVLYGDIVNLIKIAQEAGFSQTTMALWN